MRKQYTLFFWIFSMMIGYGQNLPPISEKAVISIITGSPGEPLYAAFGHTAVRVQDSATGLDVLFNYGIFDFDTPYFYLKFARGNLLYSVEVFQFAGMYALYQQEKRQMYEQVLALNQVQKQKLYVMLLEDIKPANKYYQYDFFFDNCSTRVRDLLSKTFQENLVWHYDTFPENQAFRQLIKPYLQNRPWIDTGLNLLLGQPTDRIAKPYEYMFLPDYLLLALKKTTLNEKLIIQDTKQILVSQVNKTNTDTTFSWITPWLLVGTIVGLGVFISVWEIRTQKVLPFFDTFWLLITGGLGLFLLLLWFGTEHKVLPYNWNVLWALPTNFAIVFISSKKWKKWYYLGLSVSGILLMLGWQILPQELPTPIFLIVLFITLRSAKKYYFPQDFR